MVQRFVRRSRWTLLGGVACALVACQGAPQTKAGAARAVSIAEQLVRREHPQLAYRRICSTRLTDGYIYTFRHLPSPSIEYFDVPAFPMVAVPDSGSPHAVLPASDSSRARNNWRWPLSDTAPDSTIVVATANALSPAGTLPHCIIPVLGGTLVAFVPESASARAGVLGGVMVGASTTGERAIVSRF
jgi:hypothetical protein